MRILALEFSSSRRSAAVVEDGRVLCRAGEDPERGAGPLSLMTDVLGQAGLDAKAVDCVAVGLGPGSYTGVRVAIALAQGIELGRGTKLLGVSSADSLVWQAWLGGWHGDVAVLIDAQRGELYAARYQVTQFGVAPSQPLAILPRADLEQWVREGALLLGPDLEGCQLPIRPLHPEAGMVGVLAAGSSNFVPGHALTPIYLRQVNFAKAPAPRVVPPLDRASAAAEAVRLPGATVHPPTADNPPTG
jgi:tRNA threonylcarbamoyladenosine biosynthesis protein TsaB